MSDKVIMVPVVRGEPICNECKHQEKRLGENPCRNCSVLSIFWEPKDKEAESL